MNPESAPLPPSLTPLIDDVQASPRVRAVFDDIRRTRGTDYVNHIWRALANDPAQLEMTWAQVKQVMAPGALDPLVKELLYVAISVVNSCSYCVHTHTHAARAKGMTDAMYGELLQVIALASQTNRLAVALQVPVDERYRGPATG
jgi:AhpD family alkylhydroperoxidase